jgi:hypothetical protein
MKEQSHAKNAFRRLDQPTGTQSQSRCQKPESRIQRWRSLVEPIKSLLIEANAPSGQYILMAS